MIEPKFLPIGTVVMLKGGSKGAMITGFCPVAEGNKMFDYSGCLYPEGVLSSDQTLLFNHDQILQVFAKGFVDQEQVDFMAKLNQIVASIGAGQNPQAQAQPSGPVPPAGVAPVQPSPMEPMPQMPVGQAPMPQAPVQPGVPPVNPDQQ